MHEIIATYRIVTPMFIGNAEQSPKDGVRPPSVKGALRFWWRALNWGKFLNKSGANDTSALREMHKEEARLFGCPAEETNGRQIGGQGCFFLRVQHKELASLEKDSVHPDFKPTLKDKNGEIDQTHLAAARYLGYGLMVPYGRRDGTTKSGQLKRGCLNAGPRQEFTVKLLFKNRIEDSIREALIAWGLLGGLGSRSRHGLGSIALVSLTASGYENWEAPIAIKAYDEQIKSRFSTASLPATKAPLSAFWKDSRIDRLLSGSTAYAVLDTFGNSMLDYRSWGQSARGQILPSGKKSERRFQNDHDWSKNAIVSGGKSWRDAHSGFHPERVVFGLPHNYGQPDNQKVNAENYERRSSPLLFHVHPIGSRFVGVSIHIPARFLPVGERINAGGDRVPENVKWSVITDLLDGKVGNPPTTQDRFPAPDKQKVLP